MAYPYSYRSNSALMAKDCQLKHSLALVNRAARVQSKMTQQPGVPI